MAGNDFMEWYTSVPQITRYWFTGSVILPLLGKLGFVRALHMFYEINLVVRRFHFWRPFTSVFYYPVTPITGIHYLINLFFLYSYSSRLEATTYDGKPADYAFMLIFNWLCLLLIGTVAPLYLLMDALVLSVVYVWCQLNFNTEVSFWFGTRFKAMYLPWVLFCFNAFIQGGGLNELLGITVGHLYFFLMFKYPQDFGGRQLLVTPGFLHTLFPGRQGWLGQGWFGSGSWGSG